MTAHLDTVRSKRAFASGVARSVGKLASESNAFKAGRACSGARRRHAWSSSLRETRCERGAAPPTACSVDRMIEGILGSTVAWKVADDAEAILVCCTLISCIGGVSYQSLLRPFRQQCETRQQLDCRLEGELLLHGQAPLCEREYSVEVLRRQ